MPNGRQHLRYEDFGAHRYSDPDGTSDCLNRCGCWMGPARSGGPAGVDPFGCCPGNLLVPTPVSMGELISAKEVLDDFINARMDNYQKELHELRKYRDIVNKAGEESNEALVAKLDAERNRADKAERLITKLSEYVTWAVSNYTFR